jgi:hypothetical protein
MSENSLDCGPEPTDAAARLQKQLDEALQDSFPASDPVSLVTSQEEEYWEEDRPADSATSNPAASDPLPSTHPPR